MRKNAIAARSLDLLYLCSYDVNGLREFVQSPTVIQVFAIESVLMDTPLEEDTPRMKFVLRTLQQVLFGEQTIALGDDAMAKRVARRRVQRHNVMPEQPAS